MSYLRMPRGKWGEWRAKNIAGWFTDHRATLTRDADGTERLRWAAPGTGMYGVNYIATGPLLIVTGDIGAAIYSRHDGGLAWWASLELGYFASKCIASPEGRQFTEWWSEAARDRMFSALSSAPRDKRGLFFRTGGKDACETKAGWHDWLNQHGYAIWNDAWEYGDAGEVIAQCCEAHLVGLQMAMRQLAGAETRSAA